MFFVVFVVIILGIISYYIVFDIGLRHAFYAQKYKIYPILGGVRTVDESNYHIPQNI